MTTIQNRTAQSIYPGVRYEDARAAIGWLTSVLGFQEHEVCAADDGSIQHAELRINGNLIMLGTASPGGFTKSPRELGGASFSVYVALDAASDVDALRDRAKHAGAEIVRELTDTDYGSREFSVRDPEGYVWSFGTYRP
jgi:uncharacterized glyoxalase superfamily protein PhnB